MKIYLTILLSLLFVPVFSFAAYTDVTMSGSSIINVGGSDLVVSGTAYFDSITVGSNSFSVVMSKNAELIVTSADKSSFGVYPVEYKKSFVCGSSNSTLTIGNANRDEAVTATIEPSSACSSGTSGSGGGGMIISGGGGSSAPVVPPQIAQVTTPAAAAPSPTAVAVSSVFTVSLKLGSSGADIKRLQQILNSDPDTQIAASGVGSSGNETEYFGSLTEKAVGKFQEKYGIAQEGDPGYGYVGPKTRAKIQEVFKKQ